MNCGNRMRQLAVTLLLTLAAAGCGGGGGGGGGTAPGTAPSISKLTYSPTVARVGSGAVSVTGTIEFSDARGDLATLTLIVLDAQQKQLSSVTSPIQGAAGQTSGTLTGAVQVAATTAGTFTIQVFVTDSAGARSNVLDGSFQVVAVSSQATVVTQTGPGANSLVLAMGGLYWAETGSDALKTVPVGGGTARAIATRMMGPYSMAFAGADVIWLDAADETSPACASRVLKRTATDGSTTVLATGPACANRTTSDLVVIGTTAYWLTSTAYPNNAYAINATPLAGGPTATVTTSTALIGDLAGYAGTLYWMESNYPNTGSSAIRSYQGSGPIATVASGLKARTFAVDGTSVYYDSPAGIMAQPLAGGPETGVNSAGGVLKLAVMSGTIVWSEMLGSIGPEGLWADATTGGAERGLANVHLPGGTYLRDFAFDGTTVFWSEPDSYFSTTGVIHSVPASGGTVSTDVYQGTLTDRLALDSSANLYWIETAGSAGCARIARLAGGGSATTVVSGIATHSPILVAAADKLLIADLSCIKTLPLSGGMPEVYQAGSSTIAGLTSAPDGTVAYWVDLSGSVNRMLLADGTVNAVSTPGTVSGAPPSPGTIRLAPNDDLYWVADTQTVLGVSSAASAATPDVIAQGLQGVTDLAVDSSGVFIAEQSGIVGAPLAGGTTTLLLGGNTTVGANHLMLDVSRLYWLAGGMIAKMNTDGSSAAEVIEFDLSPPVSSAPALPRSMAIDSSSVYFTEPAGPDIRKTPK